MGNQHTSLPETSHTNGSHLHQKNTWHTLDNLLWQFFFFLMSVQTLAFSPWEGQEEPVEHMLMIAGQDDCHWAVLSKRFIPKESLTQGEPPAGILALLQLQPNHWWSCTQCQWWVLSHWRGDHTAQTNPGGFRPCLCSVGGNSAPAWCGK